MRRSVLDVVLVLVAAGMVTRIPLRNAVARGSDNASAERVTKSLDEQVVGLPQGAVPGPVKDPVF